MSETITLDNAAVHEPTENKNSLEMSGTETADKNDEVEESDCSEEKIENIFYELITAKVEFDKQFLRFNKVLSKSHNLSDKVASSKMLSSFEKTTDKVSYLICLYA